MCLALKIYNITIYFRPALPSEALPATVLEVGELQNHGSEQRRSQPDKSKRDKYDVRDVIPRKVKISKGSSLSGSKSDDLVDEELAKMAEAESLNELAPNVCYTIWDGVR